MPPAAYRPRLRDACARRARRYAARPHPQVDESADWWRCRTEPRGGACGVVRPAAARAGGRSRFARCRRSQARLQFRRPRRSAVDRPRESLPCLRRRATAPHHGGCARRAARLVSAPDCSAPSTASLMMESLAPRSSRGLSRGSGGRASRRLQLLVLPRRCPHSSAKRAASARMALQIVAGHAVPRRGEVPRWRSASTLMSSALAEEHASTECAARARAGAHRAAIALGGSFPSRPGAATRAQVERCYPQLRQFLAEKRRIDPAGKLSNAWYRHFRCLLERTTCAVRFSQG